MQHVNKVTLIFIASHISGPPQNNRESWDFTSAPLLDICSPKHKL